MVIIIVNPKTIFEDQPRIIDSEKKIFVINIQIIKIKFN